jgi:hypothetical protein
MSRILRFHPAIPGGWRIWKEDVEVAGIATRIADVRKFVYGRSQDLRLEQDADNARDPNAIKVMGHYKGWFFSHVAHIGFVPAEEAEAISRRDFADFMPRLRSIWIGDQTSLAIVVKFDVLETNKPRTKRLPKLGKSLKN